MFCMVLGAAADLAAAIQLSINDHIVSIPPGILPTPPVRLESLHSSRGGRVSPAGIEVPNIKSIEDLKDHLSIGSIFRMKRDWLRRYIATRCSILLC
jgi:hypothetical protein